MRMFFHHIQWLLVPLLFAIILVQNVYKAIVKSFHDLKLDIRNHNHKGRRIRKTYNM